MEAPTCATLAAAQLAAYNAKDIEAFCDCYADDVTVLDSEGQVTQQGMAQFRQRYGALFDEWTVVGARVDQRLTLEPHVIDDETWWRSRDDQTLGGRVLVRYTARQSRIAVVQFFKGDA